MLRTRTPPGSDANNILGILSLVFWSLVIIISVKYLLFVARADNRGEGGILALMSLVRPRRSKRRGALLGLGLFGAALLYGDGMVSPAMAVLSATEGLAVATPVFRPYIVPLTVLVLVGLFTVQKHGTGRMGQFFGPVMILWFTVLASLGIRQIITEPAVLGAVIPTHAFRFFMENGWTGSPTWGISESSRSGSPGSPWSFLPCC